jgi:polyvinyl alcohol dehydrogenase (cytochrome)
MLKRLGTWFLRGTFVGAAGISAGCAAAGNEQATGTNNTMSTAGVGSAGQLAPRGVQSAGSNAVASAGRAGVPANMATAPAGGAGASGNAAPPVTMEPPAMQPTAAPEAPCTNCWKYMSHSPVSHFTNPAETKLSAANVSTLVEAWTFAMAGSATGTAAVVNGIVYAPSMGQLVAFDAAAGGMKWTSPQNIPGSVSYDEGKLYVQNAGGVVVQLDAATGAPGWQAPVGSFGGFGTPLPVGNKVLVGASSGEENLVAENAQFRGKAVALDKATGKVLWEHFTAVPPASGAAIWSSPSVDLEAGMAFFSTGNNYTGMAGDESDSIIALDLESGMLLWKYQALANDVYTTVNRGPGPDLDFGTNPIVFEGGGKKLVGAGQKSGQFWALDRMTGQVVWMHQVGGGCGIGGVFNNGAFDGKNILVSSWGCAGTSTLKALDAASGNPVWMQTLPAQSWAPITVANGVGFVPSQNTLNAFDVATGKTLYTTMVAGSISSGAVVVDGFVYFGSGVPPLAGSFGGPIDDKVFHALKLP